jgi:glyoxylase I family protein
MAVNMKQSVTKTNKCDAQMVTNGFHHVALRVKDFDESVGFYTEGLGFKNMISWGDGNSKAIMLDTGNGNNLELFSGGSAGQKPEGAIIHMAFRTDDCDAAINKARSWGAEVTMEPKDVEINSMPPAFVRIAFCKGPDGEVIEFFQSKSIDVI